MSEKARAAVAEARDVALFLDSIDEHKRANDVRRVCRSNDSYRVTLSQLHKDNMALRNKFCASEAQFIASGAPTEEVLAVTLEADLTGSLRETFERECAERGCSPAELLADILTTVARDGLFAAVLDA
ncbi:hypothetical protein [Croceibacterium aestuarii]|uniref:hypothetical protein n=1 Tax=Croceibacterium aestuarii TaxID=3064139 RepID=UPI00272EE75A|nr:hypothetical protein [Croceibacterium sp. D39]